MQIPPSKRPLSPFVICSRIASCATVASQGSFGMFHEIQSGSTCKGWEARDPTKTPPHHQPP